MIDELKEKLGYSKLISQSRPFLKEDFIFLTHDFEVLQDYKVVHQELTFVREKLTVIRDLYLVVTENPNKRLRVCLHYFVGGFRNAIEALFSYPLSFERRIELDEINDMTQQNIGDGGFYWEWGENGHVDECAFVRNNVFVVLSTSHRFDLMELARELDHKLGDINVSEAFEEQSSAYFTKVKAGDLALRVAVRGKLDIGPISDEFESSFFITSSGSMNRDPVKDNSWYFRAGNEAGTFEIVHYGVKNGILPYIDRLKVEIYSEKEDRK